MEQVVSGFKIRGTFRKATKIGIGHIHQSFRIDTTESSYFLQKINDRVFPVDKLASNIRMVTDHLRGAYTDNDQYMSLSVVSSKDVKDYVKEGNHYWRMFDFMDGLRSYDNPLPEQIGEGARAFGAFTKALDGISTSKVQEIIPKFQSMKYRLDQLKTSTETCSEDRLNECLDELSIVNKLRSLVLELENAWSSDVLPTRIIHNDTKFNNVLFDKSNKARCVVDLDTVMPGVIHFDLGDGLRTTATTAREDEERLETVEISKGRYDAFLSGYLDGLGDISESEEKFIPYAGMYMSMIMGIRFLADYLNGNQYYHVEFPEQNWFRARCQLHLALKFKEFNKL